jgi:alkylation response protein AidB-like acyl-CoA dehydrogenase
MIRGGAFLIEDGAPEGIFTAEDLSQEHLAIARTVDEFWAREVEPNIGAIQQHQPGVARDILRKAAGLGLTAIMIPEKFGGMELDITAMMVAGEHFAGDASWSGWQSAHVGIGTLPLLLFGNEPQKRKYLPKLASLEMLAAYALTEPHAGSDALAARTRADLSEDGTHYILNGQKMWITNGGAADLFTVFAKVGGEKFTAFLVERGFGVKIGAEEQKMGIKGSSTTALFFDNVPVPVENVLGEIGRGHIIAFNILNLGRLKLGAGTLGGAKKVLATCLKYAKDRRAFGSPIADFGAIQHKLAEMAIRIYAAECESLTWQKGTHRLKFGGDLNPTKSNGLWGFCTPMCVGAYSPTYIRNVFGAATALYFPTLPTALKSSADVLNLPVLNINSSIFSGIGVGSISTPAPYGYNSQRYYDQYRVYFQDTWKITPRFTLNYGLAWNAQKGFYNSNLAKPQYLAPILGTGPDNLGPTVNNTRQFQPAFGFAWSPLRDNKTVIRGGAGIYWDSTPGYYKLREAPVIGPVCNGRSTLAASAFTNIYPGIINFAAGNAPLPVGANLQLSALYNMTIVRPPACRASS